MTPWQRAAVRTGALLAALILGLASFPTKARACAVCSCGDPTLTTMGAEQPYQGRLRASLEGSSRTDTVGAEGVDRLHLSERRLDARIAWAPHERAFLLLTLPLLSRTVEYVNLARHNTNAMGDVELHARIFLFRDRDYDARHLVSVLAGVRLPTAPLQRGKGGALLPIELQSGTGSFAPALGLAYAHFAFPWSLYVSAATTYATPGPEGFRASRTLATTVAGQYQLHSTFGLRLGVDSRLEGKSLEGGIASPDSGGWISFAAGELLWSPSMDWTLYGSVRLPVWNALDGHHLEGPIFGTGVSYDFR